MTHFNIDMVLILIGGVILFVKWITDGNKIAQNQGTDASPFEILRKRYAKGEITKEEFESKREDLGLHVTHITHHTPV